MKNQLINRFVYYKQANSTNEIAINSISKNNPKHNTCIYTYNQTAGRGQIGRHWFSGNDKNITCTFIIYPDLLNVEHSFLINLVTALAVLNFVEDHLSALHKVYIKWPNDIYVGDKKIAGILIQNQLRGTQIQTCMIGMGININQEAFPQDIPNPTSLSLLTNHKYDLLQEIHSLSMYVYQAWMQFLHNPKLIKQSYLDKLYRKDNEHLFIIEDSKQTTGIITGITDDGRLRVMIDQVEKRYGFREIQYVI